MLKEENKFQVEDMIRDAIKEERKRLAAILMRYGKKETRVEGLSNVRFLDLEILANTIESEDS